MSLGPVVSEGKLLTRTCTSMQQSDAIMSADLINVVLHRTTIWLSAAMVAIRFKQRSWNSFRAKRPPWFQILYM